MGVRHIPWNFESATSAKGIGAQKRSRKQCPDQRLYTRREPRWQMRAAPLPTRNYWKKLAASVTFWQSMGSGAESE